MQTIDYISYLGIFDHLYEIPKEKKTSEYKRYLVMLLNYLMGYISRIKPLLDMDKEIDNVKKDFLGAWESGTFPGWPVSPCFQRHIFIYKKIFCSSVFRYIFFPTWVFMNVTSLCECIWLNSLQKETGSVLMNVGAHLDLSAFSSPEELASLGLDRLKSALMALGLKCGG